MARASNPSGGFTYPGTSKGTNKPAAKIAKPANPPTTNKGRVVAKSASPPPKPAKIKAATKNGVHWALKLTATAMIIVILAGIAGGGYGYHRYEAVVANPEFPKLEELMGMQLEVSTQVYDNTGTHLIGEIFQTRRIPVALPDVSPRFIDALMSAEDASFYTHHGVDWVGIAKAIARKPLHPAGASTLTQQTIKNRLWIKRGKTRRDLNAKIEEAALAMELEKIKSKDEILTDYLNSIYLGRNRYGVEAATQYYFGHSAKEMDLSEASLLAALPKGPNNYTAWKNQAEQNKALARWKARQQYVLGRMVKLGKATVEDARAAAEAPIKLADPASDKAGVYDECVDLVQKELGRRYADKLFRTSLKVVSTCDWQMQLSAKQAVERGLETIDGLNGSNPMPQGAEMVMDETGAILAVVGGYGYQKGKYNRATQAKRQAGSLFKTFEFLAAFESGQYTPESPFMDSPTDIPPPQAGAGIWSPRNSHTSETDGQEVPLWVGLAKSLNTVAGALIYAMRTEANPLAGVDATINVVRRLGITSPMGRNYAMVLGTSSVSPFEMVRGFNTISNGGKRAEPRIIISVNGVADPVKPAEQAVKASAAYMANLALEKVTSEGTGVRAGRALKRPIAGKTGTSQNEWDGWFCGSVKESGHVITSCAWVGYDDNTSLGKIQVGSERGKDFEGSNTALRHLWIPFMQATLQGKPVEGFQPPTEETTVVAAAVEEEAPAADGEVATDDTQAVPEIEEEDKEPQQLVAPF